MPPAPPLPCQKACQPRRISNVKQNDSFLLFEAASKASKKPHHLRAQREFSVGICVSGLKFWTRGNPFGSAPLSLTNSLQMGRTLTQ